MSEKSIFDGIQDTEAYVAANDDLIMAVFRGTKELTDWSTNLNAIPKRVPDTWGLKGEGCDVHEVRKNSSVGASNFHPFGNPRYVPKQCQLWRYQPSTSRVSAQKYG